MAEPKRKWTPGPWVVGEMHVDDEGCRELPVHMMADGRAYTPAVCLQFPTIEGMQEANAYLIAAAPEMFSALWQVRDLFEPDESISHVIDAALAKALGDV